MIKIKDIYRAVIGILELKDGFVSHELRKSVNDFIFEEINKILKEPWEVDDYIPETLGFKITYLCIKNFIKEI